MKINGLSPPGRSKTRKSGKIWWLFGITFLLFTDTHQGEALNATPNWETAMRGFDPLMTDVMEQPDLGRRGSLFTARDVEKKEVYQLNSFVDMMQQSTCTPSFTEAVLHTYEEYKSLKSAAISFATEADATTPLGAAQFNFKEKAGYGNLNNPNCALISDFFNQSQGEARFIKATCVTHTVSILPLHEPVFTPAFTSALHFLLEAATDPNSEARKNVFTRFVRSYGSHFARTTYFGYAAYFGKVFATQAKTSAEEDVRRRCMLESATETLTPGARSGCETIGQHFSRAVADKCGGEEEVVVLVTETGSASVSGVDDCDLTPKESPEPVAYSLEKISALFDESWISSQAFEINQVLLNGSTLAEYFEEQLGKHSQDVIERADSSSRKKSSWRRSISPNIFGQIEDLSEEEDKTSSIGDGAITIMGGLKTPRPNTPYSAALFGPTPPAFPVAVYGNTLSRVGNSVLYSCGGGDSINSKKCWVTDTAAQDASWLSFDIPYELYHHSAVVVQEEIWFFINSKLRILNTSNPVKNNREIDLGFSFGQFISAVVHGSQIFVIGVGAGKNEIYVNKNTSKPEQWEKFSTMMQGVKKFGAVVLGEELIVTGGRRKDTSTYLSSVEAISVVNGTVRALSPLSGVRCCHKMAIIQSRPAVLGGYNGTAAMATIEIYNEQKKSWETQGYSLNEARCYFGLTQYFS